MIRYNVCDAISVAQLAPHHVSAQRQRQPRPLLPPDAEIDDQVQPLIPERQLPLMDDQPRVVAARATGRMAFGRSLRAAHGLPHR